MMKQAVLDSVTLPAKVESLINKVCNRAYVYGVVPFDWDIIVIKEEATIYAKLLKQVLSFVQENASRIKAKDYSMLTDPQVQADLNEMIETVSESSFVEQLFFPFVEGSFKGLTLTYTDGEMVYDATLDDVLTYSLPNFWKVVNAVYEVTEFKRANLNANSILANLDAVAEIVEIIGTDIMTKGNAAKVIITGIEYFTTIDLTEEEKNGLLAIDFSNEVQYSNEFFAKLEATYNANQFEFSLSAIKDSNVLLGIVDAIEAVLPSETAQTLINVAVELVNNKFVSQISKELSALVLERINDPQLTNELLVEDIYAAIEFARLAAESNMLSNLEDYAAWNFAPIKAMVAICFDTNMAQGYEAEFAKASVKVIPHINEYYDESVVVADWEAEILAIVNALESLVNDGVTDINDVNVDNVSGTTVGYVVDSVILSDLIIDMINEELEAQDLSQYYVVTKESLDSVTDWDAELNAIKELTDLMEGLNANDLELSEIILECKDIRNNTVLVNEVLVSSASHIVPKLPIISDYYNDSIIINDWAEELDAIVAAYEALDGKHLETMENPIDNLDGEIIVACLESAILKEAFVAEFNNNLNANGLGSYYTVTVVEVENVNTATAWNEELQAIKVLEKLLEKINNNTVSQDDIANAEVTAANTQIAKEILESVLDK